MTCGALQVARLQTLLGALLDVPRAADIGAYLVGEEALVDLPGSDPRLPEQIFVQERAGELAVSLYIAPAVLAQLVEDDPFRRLHAGNMESFFIALEGVSHFIMLRWRATWGLPVRPLELEIQAEADKFVAALLLASRLQPVCRADGWALWARLFAQVRLREAVPAGQEERYRLASCVASSFCRQLLAAGRPRGLMRAAVVGAARSYFRSPLSAKLGRRR